MGKIENYVCMRPWVSYWDAVVCFINKAAKSHAENGDYLLSI